MCRICIVILLACCSLFASGQPGTNDGIKWVRDRDMPNYFRPYHQFQSTGYLGWKFILEVPDRTTKFPEIMDRGSWVYVRSDAVCYELLISYGIFDNMSKAITASKATPIWNYSLGGGTGSLGDTIIASGPITSIPTVAFNPGPNINAGEWIMRTFYQFVDATISLTASVLKEVGTSTTNTLTATITPNGETLFYSGYIDMTVPNGGTVLSWAQEVIPAVHTVDVTFNPLQGNADSLTKAYVAYEDVGSNNTPQMIYSSAVTFTSCYPYLYGMSASDLSASPTLYSDAGITKIVQTYASSVTVNFNSGGLSKYAYFAYPSSYGYLTSIKDQNLYQWIGAFNVYPIHVSSSLLAANWSNEDYLLYMSKTPFVTVNGPWPFIFSK